MNKVTKKIASETERRQGSMSFRALNLYRGLRYASILLASLFVFSTPGISTAFATSDQNAPDVTGAVNETDTGDIDDPLEPVNRVLFFVHDGLDTMFLRPVAVAYTTFMPKPLRKGVSNFMSNVATPVTLSNDLLQGEWERAGVTTKRFVVNSTIGLGGLLDVAATQGLPKHTEDFGQTLAVHGVGSGPYIFIPVLGPSTPRHLVGRAVDLLTDPWTYILYNEDRLVRTAPTAIVAVPLRGESDKALNSIKETSGDYYSSVKNLYYQSRRSQINNGKIPDEDLVEIPGFDSQ